MKLQKNTLGLLISAMLLSLAVVSYEVLIKPSSELSESNTQKIFDIKEDDITQLTLNSQGKILQFQRKSGEGAKWEMIQPQIQPANDAVISFLLNLLVNEKSDRRFTVTDTQLKDYGLDRPWAIITLDLKNNQKQTLSLGKSDFQDQFIYARINDNSEVLLVSKSFQYALERDLKEWQANETESQEISPSPQ